jgi:hypothetical protein
VARPVQVAIAREMISPTSQRNITLQLNMGEGKSSVIVPLVVSTLANGSNLVRVMTLRPLSNQMFQLLVSRLSGLANRPIFYVPISRNLRTNTSLFRKIRGLFERCVSEGGILIVQPEHVLSLKLMHMDTLLSHRDGIKAYSLADEKEPEPQEVVFPSLMAILFHQRTRLSPTARSIRFGVTGKVSGSSVPSKPKSRWFGGSLSEDEDSLEDSVTYKSQGGGLSTGEDSLEDLVTYESQGGGLSEDEDSLEDSVTVVDELEALQDWLTKVSCDILDESDEILHVQYQLVYTSGKQMPVEDHPNRWTTIQQVFSRLQAHVVKLCATFPIFAIDTTQRGFPIIPTLDSTIIRHISSLIIDDALQGRLSNLPVGVIPSPIEAAARRFISQAEVSDMDHGLIHSRYAGTTFFNGILLLRGLLMEGEGVLCYVLNEKRWRVDYGLDPSRTLLAVPYRAKVRVCCTSLTTECY